MIASSEKRHEEREIRKGGSEGEERDSFEVSPLTTSILSISGNFRVPRFVAFLLHYFE